MPLKTFKTHLNESSLARIKQHVLNRNIGIITANRGESSAEENLTKNRNLEKDIRKAGHGFIHVKGRYIENRGTPKEKTVDSEHSYIVVGNKGDDRGALRGFLLHHGQKYGQESTLYKPHNSTTAKFLHTKADPSKHINVGDEEDIGHFHPEKIGDYHSSLLHKKKGSFSFAEDVVLEYKFLVNKTPITFHKGELTEFI